MTNDQRQGERRKAPSLQWYPGDWLRDTSVRSCSLAARGLWREMLDYMHDGTPYGHLRVKGKDIAPETLAVMVGAKVSQVRKLLAELDTAGVYSRTPEGTIYCRRMVRDEKVRQARAAGGIKSQENPNVPRPKDILTPATKDTSKDIPKDGTADHPLPLPLQSASASAPIPTTSKALVAPSATPKLSVPEIVSQLQDTAVQARRRETAGARREMFAEIVFAYWATKLGHTRTFIDPKRRATLRSRLVENGDDLSELLYVVDGALRDDWTMGRDARSTKRFDGIETIYQDRAHVEKFAGMSAAFKKGEPHPMATKYGEAA